MVKRLHRSADIKVIYQQQQQNQNSEILSTQICPDIENSEYFTKQIISRVQYVFTKCI